METVAELKCRYCGCVDHDFEKETPCLVFPATEERGEYRLYYCGVDCLILSSLRNLQRNPEYAWVDPHWKTVIENLGIYLSTELDRLRDESLPESPEKHP